MLRFATLVFLCAGVLALSPGVSRAAGDTGGLKKMLKAARITDTIVIPQEWGGIWSSVDSTYDCSGTFDFVESYEDTLCPGEVVVDEQQLPVTFNCTGSATATTVDVECTGTDDSDPDCVITFSYSIHGTRSGDTYFVVATTQISAAGPGLGCEFFPSSCTQLNSRGTRIGPTPVEYCQTPVAPTSWGRLKVQYR